MIYLVYTSTSYLFSVLWKDSDPESPLVLRKNQGYRVGSTLGDRVFIIWATVCTSSPYISTIPTYSLSDKLGLKPRECFVDLKIIHYSLIQAALPQCSSRRYVVRYNKHIQRLRFLLFLRWNVVTLNLSCVVFDFTRR